MQVSPASLAAALRDSENRSKIGACGGFSRCAALRATVWGGTIMGTSIEECDEAVPLRVPVAGGSSTDLPRTETVAVSLCQRPRAERSRQARRAEVAASARSGGGCGGGRAGATSADGPAASRASIARNLSFWYFQHSEDYDL